MKTKLMALMLVASGAVFAETRVSIGVQIGRPAPVAVVEAYRPPCPGPGYVWVEGYYDEYNSWVDGYWAMPPYEGAYWVAPRIVSGHFYAGRWDSPRHEFRSEPRPVPPREAPPAFHERGGFDRDFHGRGGEFSHGFRR